MDYCQRSASLVYPLECWFHFSTSKVQVKMALWRYEKPLVHLFPSVSSSSVMPFLRILSRKYCYMFYKCSAVILHLCRPIYCTITGIRKGERNSNVHRDRPVVYIVQIPKSLPMKKILPFFVHIHSFNHEYETKMFVKAVLC